MITTNQSQDTLAKRDTDNYLSYLKENEINRLIKQFIEDLISDEVFQSSIIEIREKYNKKEEQINKFLYSEIFNKK